MKKLVFVFAIMLGISVASCGRNSNDTAETVDTVEVATDSITSVDTVAVDSVM